MVLCKHSPLVGIAILKGIGSNSLYFASNFLYMWSKTFEKSRLSQIFLDANLDFCVLNYTLSVVELPICRV